jgi:hypothetical protein
MSEPAKMDTRGKRPLDLSKKWWWLVLTVLALPIVLAIINKYPFRSDTPVPGTTYIGTINIIEHQYQQFLGQPLDDVDLGRIKQANELAKKGYFQAAAALIQEVAQKAPVPAVLNNLGVLYQGAGDQGRAKEAYNQALQKDPNYEPARDNLRAIEQLLATARPAATPDQGSQSGSRSNPTAARTGIAMHWKGANTTFCDLLDESGQNVLSPLGSVSRWYCDPHNVILWDAAPGRYLVRIDALGVGPVPVTVAAGHVSDVEPAVGQVTLHWNGTGTIYWDLLDKNEVRVLSPQGSISRWYCEPGKTNTEDVAPGDYAVRVGAVGYKPVRLTVAAYKVTDVTIP